MPILSSIGFSSAKSFGFTSASAAIPVVGSAYEGGFFAGQISTTANGIATHNLVVAPLSTGQTQNQWKNTRTATAGADSDIDGPQNTADTVADGDSTVYPCAHFCNDAVIGGFSDWYMPAKNELEVCYFNLKPTTNSNFAGGINPNAVPPRDSTYTSGNPAQTSAAAFKSGGAEAFDAADYWSSTEFNSLRGSKQSFSNGGQPSTGNYKTSSLRVRAVRRVPV